MVRERVEFHWTYQTFRVAGASDKYRFSTGGAEGSYENDQMSYHSNYIYQFYYTHMIMEHHQPVHLCIKEDGGIET